MSTAPDSDVTALLELWKGTRERIAERRSYEWKIAFGVWAAQLLAMGELVTHSSSIRRAWLLFSFYLAAGMVISFLHWVYLRRFMKVRTGQEGTRARLYEEEAAKRVLGAPLDIAVDDATGTAAHYFELGVTLSLAIIGPIRGLGSGSVFRVSLGGPRPADELPWAKRDSQAPSTLKRVR